MKYRCSERPLLYRDADAGLARYTLSVQPSVHRHLATAAQLECYDKGYEVVDGQVVRKASPSFEHGGGQSGIVLALGGFDSRVGRPGGWVFGTEVEIELEPHQVYLPDVAGWRVEKVVERPRGRPVRVAPDWVAEVHSPSTSERDLGPKLRGYQRALIGHYWIVDPLRQELRVLRWRDEGYQLVGTAAPGDCARVEPFEAIEST